ncbi:MAG: hypothetical protein RR478_05405 [Bacilli bacterium]
MKLILTYLTITLFIILVFLNNDIVLVSSIDAVNIWLYKVFPFLFIMFIINDILIKINFFKLFKNPVTYIFIMSLISGAPTSAFIISNLYKTKKIDETTANFSLMFTYFSNPLFLYTMFSLIFPFNYVIKLIIIHYVSNIIIYLFYKKNINNKKVSIKSVSTFNLASSIKVSIMSLIMILGTITFFMVLSNILINFLNLSIIPATFLKGFLEITQGLNNLINLNINFLLKEIIAIMFVSFGGFSIHTQIKSLLDETNLDYKFFFKGRLLQMIISVLLTAIT